MVAVEGGLKPKTGDIYDDLPDVLPISWSWFDMVVPRHGGGSPSTWSGFLL